MSPTERGLWAAVLAEPDDDLPRLVYADYLEENGRAPLAQFIRAQMTLSHCPPGHPGYADAVEAQSLAVAAARGASSLPAPTLPDGATFAGSIREIEGDNFGAYERGFGSRVTFSGLRMRTGPGKMAHALWRVVSETPIRELDLVHVPDSDLAELLACPAAARLRGLGISEISPNSAKIPQTLTECPHLNQVRRLSVGVRAAPVYGDADRRNPADWEAVAAAPWIAGVTRLSFSGVWLLGCFYGALGPAVTSLTMRDGFPTAFRHLQNTDAYGIERLSGLRHLALPGLTTYNSDTSYLARMPFPSISSLQLMDFDGRFNSLTQLLAAPYLTNLTELAITGPQSDAAQPVANAESLRSLRVLHLDNAIPNADCMAELARPGLFPQLTTLSLKRQNAPNDGALARFVEAWRGERLHTLILDGWPAPAAAMHKLAANPAFQSLRRLKLARCNVSDAGAVALARSPHLLNLVELDLSYNTLGEKAATLFLDTSIMPNLVLADLTTNKMRPDTRTKLRASRVGMWA